MFLNEIYDQLTSSELTRVVAGESGVILEEYQPKINRLITAGMNDLNKHFTLRENELLLRTKIGKDIYELTSENAVSSGNPYAFIIDSIENPYQNDLMMITRISDEDGHSLFLNTDVPYRLPVENIYGHRPAVFTYEGFNMMSYNTLKLHKNHDAADYLVHYKAKIKPFVVGPTPEDTYIDLADHYLNALVMYVTSRFFNPSGAETIGNGMYHEGNNYWGKYTAEVQELKNNMGSIASQGESTNFYRNGWA